MVKQIKLTHLFFYFLLKIDSYLPEIRSWKLDLITLHLSVHLYLFSFIFRSLYFHEIFFKILNNFSFILSLSCLNTTQQVKFNLFNLSSKFILFYLFIFKLLFFRIHIFSSFRLIILLSFYFKDDIDSHEYIETLVFQPYP